MTATALSPLTRPAAAPALRGSALPPRPAVPVTPRGGVVGRRLQEGRRTGGLADTPWVMRDLTRSLSIAGLGLLGLAGCAAEVSDSTRYDDQLGWTAGALVSVAVALSAGTLWILAGLRAVRLVRAEAVLRLSTHDGLAAAVADSETSSPLQAVAHLAVSGPGMSRYHLPSCPFAVGKDLQEADPAALAARGLRPCEVCQP